MDGWEDGWVDARTSACGLVMWYPVQCKASLCSPCTKSFLCTRDCADLCATVFALYESLVPHSAGPEEASYIRARVDQCLRARTFMKRGRRGASGTMGLDHTWVWNPHRVGTLMGLEHNTRGKERAEEWEGQEEWSMCVQLKRGVCVCVHVHVYVCMCVWVCMCVRARTRARARMCTAARTCSGTAAPHVPAQARALSRPRAQCASPAA
eukprot:364491-Chlamydomonas_euryale.AAC.1